MDYLRWLIKEMDLFDTPIVPIAFIASIFITGCLWNVNIVLGVLFGMVVAGVFGTLMFVVVGDAFHKSYARYLREKNKP